MSIQGDIVEEHYWEALEKYKQSLLKGIKSIEEFLEVNENFRSNSKFMDGLRVLKDTYDSM